MAIGPNSYTGYLVSTLQGSTETTFYVMAVYLGAVQVKRVRHTLTAGLDSSRFRNYHRLAPAKRAQLELNQTTLQKTTKYLVIPSQLPLEVNPHENHKNS